jgi:hypothetical protein
MYIIELESAVEKIVLDANDVLDLIPDKNKENKFTFVYMVFKKKLFIF